MAFRIQGQKDTFDGIIAGAPANSTLDAIDAMIDWGAVRAILARGYDSSGKGWTGIDPVVLFKMLILEQIYNLSDVRVSVEAGDRLSFRRFLSLSAGETAPDDTTLVKFRKRMRKEKLLDKAHAEFNRQLSAQNLFVRPGTIKVIDATVIRAATRPPKTEIAAPEAEKSSEQEQAASQPNPEPAPPTEEKTEPQPAESSREAEPHRPGPAAPPARRERIDTEAAFGGKKGNLQYGYKLHGGIDAETGMISAFEVTPANVSDMNVFGQLLDGTESATLADKGYDSEKNRELLKKNGTKDGIMRRMAPKGGLKAALNEIEKERNTSLARLRSPSEGVFGALKRWRRLGRAVYTGLVRFREQASLAVLAHNILKAVGLREKCAQ